MLITNRVSILPTINHRKKFTLPPKPDKKLFYHYNRTTNQSPLNRAKAHPTSSPPHNPPVYTNTLPKPIHPLPPPSTNPTLLLPFHRQLYHHLQTIK